MSRSTQTQSQRREPIRDPKYKMPFGRYKDFTIEEIMQGDPRYLLWLQDNTDFELHADLFDELTKSPDERAAEIAAEIHISYGKDW